MYRFTRVVELLENNSTINSLLDIYSSLIKLTVHIPVWTHHSQQADDSVQSAPTVFTLHLLNTLYNTYTIVDFYYYSENMLYVNTNKLMIPLSFRIH